jgi:uncharacterized protein YjiS (DUF1127 family)
MTMVIERPARQSAQLHEKNLGRTVRYPWPGWLGLWERQLDRKALRELADDPHMLSDLGLTRQQLLHEAEKPFWR